MDTWTGRAFFIAMALALGVAGCVTSDPDAPEETGCPHGLDPGEACAPIIEEVDGEVRDFGRFCAVTDAGDRCINVCRDARNRGDANGRLGDFCELDEHCDAPGTCDNDEVGGGASCQCIQPPGCHDVLEAGNAAFFRARKTCVKEDGTCVHDRILEVYELEGPEGEDTPFTTVRSDVEENRGKRFVGNGCPDGSFRWAQVEGSGFEEGVWTIFGFDTFAGNTRVYDERDGTLLHTCQVNGALNASADDDTDEPQDPPSCEDLAPSDDLDLPLCTECPNAPGCPIDEPALEPPAPCGSTPLARCYYCNEDRTQYYTYDCYDSGMGVVWHFAGEAPCPQP